MKGREGLFGCGCMISILVANLSLGAFATDYSLWYILGKNIPWYGDMLIGLVAGEITMPLMFICFILRTCGVDAPLVN